VKSSTDELMKAATSASESMAEVLLGSQEGEEKDEVEKGKPHSVKTRA
jgi:hypothetical protein